MWPIISLNYLCMRLGGAVGNQHYSLIALTTLARLIVLEIAFECMQLVEMHQIKNITLISMSHSPGVKFQKRIQIRT